MRSAETVSESRRISGASWLSSTNAAAVSFRPQRCIITSYVLVVAATAIARLPGLNPASLWWDDLWVATLAKASLREAIITPATTPPGFLLILWLFRRLIPDPEWSLQLFPFLCGLVVVPLTGVAVSRITEISLLGL